MESKMKTFNVSSKFVHQPANPRGACIFVDGLGDAPATFWKLRTDFIEARPDWFCGRSSHERDDFWNWAEVFYAFRLPLFVIGHSLGGTMIATMSEWTPPNIVIGFDPVWPDWDLRPARVRLIDDLNAATQSTRHNWRSFRHCASYLRKQGSGKRIMPGVAYECREIMPAVVRCEGGHNSIIREVAPEVLRLLISAAGT